MSMPDTPERRPSASGGAGTRAQVPPKRRLASDDPNFGALIPDLGAMVGERSI